MWAIHHRNNWKDLDALEEPTTVGRRLDAGGFLLADSFETFLSNISQDYLRRGWEHLSNVLTKYRVQPSDLSWGWFHAGETFIEQRTVPTPMDYFGWTSCQLWEFDNDYRYRLVDDDLAKGTPALRCKCTWRSNKWKIAPQEYMLALRLVEAICTDELSNWNPSFVLRDWPKSTDAWVKMAEAIENKDQLHLDEASESAHFHYTILGYRIVIRAYSTYIHSLGLDLHLPSF